MTAADVSLAEPAPLEEIAQRLARAADDFPEEHAVEVARVYAA